MKRFVLVLAVVAFQSVAFAQSSNPSMEERCAVPTGDGGFHVVPGFSILNGTPPFHAPEGYSDLRAIMCGRTTLFIAPNDYRVLMDLSVPLNISSSDDRIMAFEISNGQFRARMIQGEFTESEATAVLAALNRAQSIIQGEAQP